MHNFLDGEEGHVNGVKAIGMTPPTPAQNVRHGTRRSLGEDGAPATKRPRLVFTDIQKRTLQASCVQTTVKKFGFSVINKTN